MWCKPYVQVMGYNRGSASHAAQDIGCKLRGAIFAVQSMWCTVRVDPQKRASARGGRKADTGRKPGNASQCTELGRFEAGTGGHQAKTRQRTERARGGRGHQAKTWKCHPFFSDQVRTPE